LPLGCSGDDGGAALGPGDDALIVPEDLTVIALPGGNGVLDVTALTLQKGPSNTELYVALKNDGDIPACHAAVSVELFDRSDQSLAAGISGLLTTHFYRLTDGSETIAACVAPGDVTMAAITDLPADLVLEDVGSVVYRCPYFALDVAPIAGLDVTSVASIAGDRGTSYTGTLFNGFDLAVTNPSVTVFPVNRVGRPLGVAIASGSVELMPGGNWPFTTNNVDAHAADQAAYPAAALAKE
jgi:hypothetical protein